MCEQQNKVQKGNAMERRLRRYLKHISLVSAAIFYTTIEHFIRNIPIGLSGGTLRRAYYARRFASSGKNIYIGTGVFIYGASNMKVGSNVEITENTIIQASGGLTIGDNVLFGPGCFIWTVNHDYRVDNIALQKKYEARPTIIENNVWIGANSKIVPGVKIGNRSVVAMGSVVTKEVPPQCVVAGNPAKIVKILDKS
jgi:acetyltransferase-like isoleucine patch superfamily enzyme